MLNSQIGREPETLNEQASIAAPAIPVGSDAQEIPALCFVGTSKERLWGLSPVERLTRAFARHGVTRVLDVTDLEQYAGPVIVLRGDAVIDAPLIAVLIEREGLMLIGEDSGTELPVAAHTPARSALAVVSALEERRENAAACGNLTAMRPSDLEASFWKSLRKREVPYALLLTAKNRKTVEWRMFMGTYKGATDFVTKHFWPRPAFVATRIIAPWGITPNMVTTLSAVFVVAAYFYFLNGSWLLGLISAWLMTFLDTVDGKLARVTLTSSKWGDIFDHGIDLVHPPFWYTAWAVGVMASTTPLSSYLFWPVLTIILGGYLLQRIIEGISIKFFSIEIHIWRPIDTLFRQITARRNPNLAILTVCTAFGRPDWGLIGVAVWTLLSLLFHVWQLVVAAIEVRRHGPLESWLDRSADQQ